MAARRADLVSVAVEDGETNLEPGDEPMVGAVEDGDLDVSVLRLRLLVDELTVLHAPEALGLLAGVGHEVVAGGFPAAAVSFLVGDEIERLHEGVALVASELELFRLGLVAGLHRRLSGGCRLCGCLRRHRKRGAMEGIHRRERPAPSRTGAAPA